MADFVFDDIVFDDVVLVSGLRITPLIALSTGTLYLYLLSFDPRHPPLEPSTFNFLRSTLTKGARHGGGDCPQGN